MGDKSEIVHTGLEDLVRAHATDDADLSGIDEIVINYVTGVIEEVGGNEKMDAASMKDVMTAYVPGFEAVPESAVHTWMIDMVHKIQEINTNKSMKVSVDTLVSASRGSQNSYSSFHKSGAPKMSHKLSEASGTSSELLEDSFGSEYNTEYSDGDISFLLEMFPTACDLEVQHCLATCVGDLEEAACLILQRQEQQISLKSSNVSKVTPILREQMANESGCETNERSGKLSEASGVSLGSEHNECPDDVALLLEMFPATSILEVQHCLAFSNGDLEEAVCLILQRKERQVSLRSPNVHKTCSSPVKMKEPGLIKNELITDEAERQGNKSGAPKRLSMLLNAATVPDKKIRETILNKYGFIDNEEDRRDHKPVAPKVEDKKMVRYRDNKVVNSKGERYTVIKKEESEDMKKTYVNLRPWRRYRFH
ncbi:CUE domain-containing protein 2-like [Oratosquilla oratoria]|uniref:CUE domain-containing protein 2-like n=1 Tax=Oratosquilla oratoria TaxID=337810 RepID=UPI003F75C32B